MHKPVLTKQVLECLALKPNENVIDATVGQAGHTLLILEKIQPEGRVLGIDLDAGQIANAKVQTAAEAKRVVLVHDSYANVKDIAMREDFKPVNGILLDLGYSSWQIDQAERGFSFQADAPLDMRYDLQQTLTAKTIVNEYSQEELEKILTEYGEEESARKIASHIISYRKHKKIESTFELIEIIKEVIPKKFQHRRIHYATKSFQALRIAVNGELESLSKALPDMVSLLAPGGRLVVISFHSLEDRIVKTFFNNEAKHGTVIIVTKKPMVADASELGENPRSRSAKLRVIQKV